jgi:hypothetical protein
MHIILLWLPSLSLLALSSKRHGLLVELVEVLVVYACILEFLYFGLLDVFDLVSLRIDFLSDLSALLQEI